MASMDVMFPLDRCILHVSLLVASVAATPDHHITARGAGARVPRSANQAERYCRGHGRT